MVAVFSTIKNHKNLVESTLEELKFKSKKIILFGTGYCGWETFHLFKRRGIDVYKICDHDELVGRMFEGRKIKRIEDIDIDDDTIIFITSGKNEQVKAKLSELGLLKNYNNLDFNRYDEKKENYNFFQMYEKEIEKIYCLLKDSESKKIFFNLINYRISRNLKFLPNISNGIQYFSPPRWISKIRK